MKISVKSYFWYLVLSSNVKNVIKTACDVMTMYKKYSTIGINNEMIDRDYVKY